MIITLQEPDNWFGQAVLGLVGSLIETTFALSGPVRKYLRMFTTQNQGKEAVKSKSFYYVLWTMTCHFYYDSMIVWLQLSIFEGENVWGHP